MIQHFISIATAFTLGLLATFTSQHPELAGPVTVPIALTEVVEAKPLPTPPLFQIPVFPTTPVVTPSVPRPISTTTPSVPFTPLPLPTPPVVTTPTVPTVPETPVVPDVDDDAAAEALLRASIVNIICLPGGGLSGSSGSGVIIDPRGIIITVAHVAQSFLLVDYPTTDAGECYIRTGAPARNAYKAKIVYISREWIADNETTFLQSRPKGTGENDYAFLAIVDSLTGNSLPYSFSYIPFAAANTRVSVDDRVGTGSYGAEFLSSSEVRSSLYPTISFAPVNDIVTFGSGSRDLISVQAGIAAQAGSSGGAVINEDKELVGLITSRTSRSDLSLRDLQAISVDHIRRSFREDMDENLDSYLGDTNVITLINRFSNSAVEMLETLTEAIDDARD